MIQGPTLLRSLRWRFDSLTFTPATFWLRCLRTGVWVAVGVTWALGLRYDVLLLLVAAVCVQLMIAQVTIMELLRERQS